jgi:hypothetical protein
MIEVITMGLWREDCSTCFDEHCQFCDKCIFGTKSRVHRTTPLQEIIKFLKELYIELNKK